MEASLDPRSIRYEEAPVFGKLGELNVSAFNRKDLQYATSRNSTSATHSVATGASGVSSGGGGLDDLVGAVDQLIADVAALQTRLDAANIQADCFSGQVTVTLNL